MVRALYRSCRNIIRFGLTCLFTAIGAAFANVHNGWRYMVVRAPFFSQTA